MARDVAKILLEDGLSVTSFPNVHLKGVDHVPAVAEMRRSKVDLVVTVSGDGTILRTLRILDSATPCLCVNVGGRGIMAEIKPEQVKSSVQKLLKGEFRLEKRTRIGTSFKKTRLPPAMNEVFVLRQSVTRTPTFLIDFDGSTFSQRMDGMIISTPTGSTGHSYSYGSPFLEGSLDSFIVTPVGAITRFPAVVRKSDSLMRLLGSHALQMIIDGQEVFAAEPNTYVSFRRHERDAVFVRFDLTGPFRQLRNLGFT